MMDRATRKKVNKSSKRDVLIKDVTNDLIVNKRRPWSHYSKESRGSKPTTKATEISQPQLIGHFVADIYGKNLVLDGCGDIRIYNLPIIKTVIEENEKLDDSDEENAVDDWEQLADRVLKDNVRTEISIPDSVNLNFNLLKGYIPLSEGGNVVSFTNQKCDRTGGMRWMVKNHQKLKCEDSSRLFDVDFFLGNGAVQRIMTSEFSPFSNETEIAVLLIKGTYYVFNLKDDENVSELSNKRSFAGLRFEDFISRGVNGEEHGPSNGENNNYRDSLKYYNVVKLTFDKYKLLISGETDCVFPESSAALGKKPKAGDFIELKTSLSFEHWSDPKRMSPFVRCSKMSTWFAQCILMGIEHVVVGIREEIDDQIICKGTNAFTLEKLRQHSDGSWSKGRCFNDLKKFLNIVKETVTEDSAETFNIFTVKDGSVIGPLKKKISDDENLPDVSEVVVLFENLEHAKKLGFNCN